MLQPQFSGIVAMALFIFPLENAQSLGNEIFYTYYPDMAAHSSLVASWVVLVVLFVVALLLMIPVTVLLNKCEVRSNTWRMHVYTLLFLSAMIQLQVSLQLPIYYKCGAETPNPCRLKWYGISLAITAPTAYLLCTLVCNWCEAALRKLDELFLPTNPYAPVVVRQ